MYKGEVTFSSNKITIETRHNSALELLYKSFVMATCGEGTLQIKTLDLLKYENSVYTSILNTPCSFVAPYYYKDSNIWKSRFDTILYNDNLSEAIDTDKSYVFRLQTTSGYVAQVTASSQVLQQLTDNLAVEISWIMSMSENGVTV